MISKRLFATTLIFASVVVLGGCGLVHSAPKPPPAETPTPLQSMVVCEVWSDVHPAHESITLDQESTNDIHSGGAWIRIKVKETGYPKIDGGGTQLYKTNGVLSLGPAAPRFLRNATYTPRSSTESQNPAGAGLMANLLVPSVPRVDSEIPILDAAGTAVEGHFVTWVIGTAELEYRQQQQPAPPSVPPGILDISADSQIGNSSCTVSIYIK